MPKIFGKEVNPLVLYGAVAICGVLVYNAVFPAEDSASAPTRAKKKTTTKKDNSIYLPEDYEAKFASYKEPVKNAFRPLIVKKAPTVAAPTGPVLTGVLPAGLTGGEGNWAYTGYAEVDGVRQGLLENSASGESVFLVAGQRWKQLVVRSVTAENMIVAGPDGTPIPIPIKDPVAEQKATPNVLPPTGTVPVNPGAALRGTIGGATAQVPGAPGFAENTLQVQPDESMQNDRDARRRGRRNRRQGQ
ncbi:MAG: hypothetical protein ACO1SV_23270 [Fimbriimonas sp.]